MPKLKKLKCDNGGELEELQKCPPVNCILHVSDIQHQEFIPLSEVKGSPTDKLAQLHSIRDKGISEPHGSPYRMDDVCKRIPDSLDGANLQGIGYYRGCYQNFTKNQDCLKCKAAFNETSTSRSPRKSSSASSMPQFSPECICCGRLEIKVNRRTERCIKFAVFKDKDGTLKERTD